VLTRTVLLGFHKHYHLLYEYAIVMHARSAATCVCVQQNIADHVLSTSVLLLPPYVCR
jgi:hypothetical protein